MRVNPARILVFTGYADLLIGTLGLPRPLGEGRGEGFFFLPCPRGGREGGFTVRSK